MKYILMSAGEHGECRECIGNYDNYYDAIKDIYRYVDVVENATRKADTEESLVGYTADLFGDADDDTGIITKMVMRFKYSDREDEVECIEMYSVNKRWKKWVV